MRILFVENHAVFARTVIEQFLFEHSVVVVASASEALNALRDSAFDVFLVDYDLDDSKGDAFVRHLRDSADRLLHHCLLQ
jgi:CheY-like chemotaxis protein